MANLKETAEKIDHFLIPKIYQVRFEKIEPIELDGFPKLKELGDWLSHSTHTWGCHSKLQKKAFEDKFFEVTKLSRDDVKVFYGGEGMGVFSPSWRQSVNIKE